jgi:hypothetical protein
MTHSRPLDATATDRLVQTQASHPLDPATVLAARRIAARFAIDAVALEELYDELGIADPAQT